MRFALAARLVSFVRAATPTERIVFLVVVVLHGTAIGWGLPASDGWDVDGIAPRDFLPGLVETFTPGHHFTYPPFHLLLLTLLTLPVTLVQLLRAPSLAPESVVQTFIAVPVMTTFALVARLVSFAMSLGVVLLIGRVSRRIFEIRSAAAWAMAIAGVEVAGTYYGHTTNLDMPALFWGLLALDALAEAITNDEPAKLRRVALLAACAIATKDQAYALFVLPVPVLLAGWFLATPQAERLVLGRAITGFTFRGLGLVLLFDGAFFNPTGFVARVRFLTGPASQDFAQHSRDWAGTLSALEGALLFWPNHYPTLLAPIVLGGIAVAVGRPASVRTRLVRSLPLLGAISFTVFFNCVARRVEERFMMPQMQLLAVYAGAIPVVLAWATGSPRVRRPVAIAVTLLGASSIALGLRLSGSVVATMLRDARYEAEAFLRDRIVANDTIEVYGSNVYLPRFPAAAHVVRVGPEPTRRRNPMPGIVERQDRLGAIAERRPRYIVVGMGYAWRYLQEDRGPSEGRVLPKIQQVGLADVDTTSYVRALFAERAGYRLVHHAHDPGSSLFPARPLHASLATDVYIFEHE